jgi:SAM dependent carboxyl methyltransferase
LSGDAPAATAAMQGNGFYNRNSALQAANLGSALPLLVAAAGEIPVDATTFNIADYGTSQGRNSMAPVAAAIDALRPRIGPDRPIIVSHVDLPSNDFASLFTLLAEDASSYLMGRESVYPVAVGRSHFGQLLPTNSVDLGWSSNALHWMSQNPCPIPDHGWGVFSADVAVRDAIDRQLDTDWANFLQARSHEMRRGGRLICQFMGRGPDTHGFEWMANAFWQSWVDAADAGLLTHTELSRISAPSAGRSVAQIEAPFRDGRVSHLKLVDLAVVQTPDPYWSAFQQTGDAAQLGRVWADMMRAANGPSFAAALDAGRDRDAVLNGVTARLATRIAADPQQNRSYNVILDIEAIEPN